MSGVGIGIGTPFRRSGKNNSLTGNRFYVVIPDTAVFEAFITADGQRFLAAP
jgi:hypothetical protein